MFEKLNISLFEMAMSFSEALDLVSPEVVDHHKRVAYLAFRIAGAAGIAAEGCTTILLAGLLHDIGAVTRQDRLESLRFEFDDPQLHAERGYELLKGTELFSAAAGIIRHHHAPWNGGKTASGEADMLPLASHLLHLADRIAVQVRCDCEILSQSGGIVASIIRGRGGEFSPELVDLFRSLAQSECFWFDLASPAIGRLLLRLQPGNRVGLYSQQLFDVVRLFSHIIDCRSGFTANHSSGVAAVAERLAGFVGLSNEERGMIEIAGHLHDLGKLAVPAAILEKVGKLTPPEMNIVRKHPYDTYRILETVGSLTTVARWAALHHEYLNGEGYPFHYTGNRIPLGARIMAVADIFTALSEDRPYRCGMARADLVRVLEQMARDRLLDRNLAALAASQYETLDAVRRCTQVPGLGVTARPAVAAAGESGMHQSPN